MRRCRGAGMLMEEDLLPGVLFAQLANITTWWGRGKVEHLYVLR